ncbi:hypothetical protein TW95_gp1449 [Pandoravirus inopinatum]|uniref:Uncharacterized protein n=1 Tax=Pandoravirus inopinatum TaxID=1605721 RepID=A0A0B5IZ88_9VIRU|nr:hypothetical protein TW95_gp1449 [Pandoravirus inopinatum]AJF98183.1 hypothetical protein [Pandoravirus inopinatum]
MALDGRAKDDIAQCVRVRACMCVHTAAARSWPGRRTTVPSFFFSESRDGASEKDGRRRPPRCAPWSALLFGVWSAAGTAKGAKETRSTQNSARPAARPQASPPPPLFGDRIVYCLEKKSKKHKKTEAHERAGAGGAKVAATSR